MYSAEKIFERIPNFPSCHGSTLAELPNGDVLAAWYAGSREGAKDVAIFTARRFYGSEAWIEPEIVVNTPDCSEGNHHHRHDCEVPDARCEVLEHRGVGAAHAAPGGEKAVASKVEAVAHSRRIS